jgi:CelD/BcsL family acetyltransferase involved in cellulose biosynthesis
MRGSLRRRALSGGTLQSRVMTSGAATFDVIIREDAFWGLEREWRALWKRADGAFCESYDLCRDAWLHVAKSGGRTLAIVVGRIAGELVLVWPLVCVTRLSTRALRPLGPAMADPTPLLFDRTRIDERAFEPAWRALVRAVRPDLAYLTYLSDSSGMYALASGLPRARVLERDSLAIVDVRGAEAGWNAFCQARSNPGSRRKPGQLRRRLEKHGQVVVRIVDAAQEPGRIGALLEFILKHKRAWGERQGKLGPWLTSRGFRAMLSALIKGPEGRACIMALELDGRVIAAVVLGCGCTAVAALISAFDADYGRHSPGLILAEEYVRFAFERRCDLDFGVGSEELKRTWSLGNIHALTSFAVPVTLLGRLSLAARDVAAFARGQL